MFFLTVFSFISSPFISATSAFNFYLFVSHFSICFTNSSPTLAFIFSHIWPFNSYFFSYFFTCFITYFSPVFSRIFSPFSSPSFSPIFSTIFSQFLHLFLRHLFLQIQLLIYINLNPIFQSFFTNSSPTLAFIFNHIWPFIPYFFSCFFTCFFTYFSPVFSRILSPFLHLFLTNFFNFFFTFFYLFLRHLFLQIQLLIFIHLWLKNKNFITRFPANSSFIFQISIIDFHPFSC